MVTRERTSHHARRGSKQATSIVRRFTGVLAKNSITVKTGYRVSIGFPTAVILNIPDHIGSKRQRSKDHVDRSHQRWEGLDSEGVGVG